MPEVRKDLPGNGKISRHLKLSARLEQAFQNAVHEENGQFVLAMLRETREEILTAVRSKVSNQKNEAIIVANKRLRPLINQLLKLELSNSSIISQDELLEFHGNGPKDIEEIDFQ